MIVIDNVELSKNPVQVGEAILIKVTAREELAKWEDVRSKKWTDLIVRTWDQVKRKIF